MEKKFDHLLKPFLAQKLQEHLIPVHTICDIIHEATLRYEQANTDAEIDMVLQDLGTRFQELHDLAENFHYQQVGKEQKDLERKISDVIAHLLMEDPERANQLMEMVKDRNFNIHTLHQQFPNFFPL